MNSEYYLGEYIESYDGELVNVEVVREFNIGDEKYSVLRRNDGMEFVVLDYEGDNEYIWVSVDESDDWCECLGVGDEE
jgi:hypothetical protein